MSVRPIAVLALVLGLASLSAAAPPGAKVKVKYPSKMGIYAMPSQGAVELTVSGEATEVAGALRLQCYYSPADLDKIPKVESMRSFYVSAMGWAARRIYLTVGRTGLVNSVEHYQLLPGVIVPRGVVAFEVELSDLRDPDFIARTARKLAPAGMPDSQIEAYLVLELMSRTGLSPRNYPVQIVLPSQ